jgi:hypothetical protein
VTTRSPWRVGELPAEPPRTRQRGTMPRHILVRVLGGASVLIIAVGGGALARGAAAPIALTWAGGSLVLFVAMMVAAWSWNTRDLCMSDRWVACKTRLSRRWRLLRFSEVVAVVPGPYGLGVKLQRGDGRCLTIARRELTPTVAAALLVGLVANPALDGPVGETLRLSTNLL